MTSATIRRATAVALVALAVVGVPTADALGGGLADPALLVGRTPGAACGTTTVDVDYDVVYDSTLGGFGVSAARLSGLDERCQGYDMVVSLNGPGGDPLAEMTTEVDATRMRVAVPAATPVSAEQLTGVSIVLRGGEV